MTRDIFSTAIKQHQVSVNMACELGSREAIREAVADGLGVSVVAECEHVPHNDIAVKKIGPQRLVANHHMVVLDNQVNSPQVSALINILNSDCC